MARRGRTHRPSAAPRPGPGETYRHAGELKGQHVVFSEVIADVRRGSSREAFAAAGYKSSPGWSDYDQWLVPHDDHGVFMAQELRRPVIYIDPRAEMVIARFASHLWSGDVTIDPTSLPAYRVLADHLMKADR